MDPLTLATIGWGVTAASWLISPILHQLVNKCFDILDPDIRFQSRKKTLIKKLEDLQTTLVPQLIILTDAAEKSPHRGGLEAWLHKLKSAYYEVEHLLGLVEYMQLEKKVNSLFPSTSTFDFMSRNKELKNREKKLLKSLKSLEKIVNQAKKFTGLLKLSASDHRRETTSTPVFTVIGRDRDRNQIIELLREDIAETSTNGKCYSVIGIWGMAGSGKTTLAQFVCEYEKKSDYFDHVVWVHVPENFSLQSIFKRIWESAFEEDCPNCESIEGLKNRLQKKLRGKRFFLVLDDVCHHKDLSLQLEQLFAPLLDCKSGSKILITTRVEEAARALSASNPIPLRQLEENEFLDLFISRALSNLNDSEKQLEGDLKEIGEQIAAKLHRSPLAASTVAAQLRTRLDPDFWLSMLNRNLIDETMGALLLSYQNLSPPLQRCFAFCSLFPKGYKFSEDQLVSLWIGEGFIETNSSNTHVRDIGKGYILDLISSSFLQVWKDKLNTLYSIHDLLHDLAEKVSDGECFRIEGGQEREIPVQTRHLYVEAYMFEENVNKICRLKDLRTIIIWDLSFNLQGECLKKEDLNILFVVSEKLLVVDLRDCWIDRFPESVFQLENLRYLVNGSVGEQYFHESFTRMYQLRLLRGIYSDHQIPNIGRLILLQELHGFKVGYGEGCGLEQLEHLRDLYGELLIYNLDEVRSNEEARRAKLSDKEGLCEIQFNWKYKLEHFKRDILDEQCSPTQIKDEEILDELCPPRQIKRLTIKCYGGKRCPRWFSEYNTNTTHLKILQLRDCPFLEALPEINHLIHLRSLTIEKLSRLKRWAPLPSYVANLTLSCCKSLVFVSEEDLKINMPTWKRELSILRDSKFVIGINNIISVVENFLSNIANHVNEVNGELYFPLTLEKLEIKSCIIADKILASSLHGHTKLTNLALIEVIPITIIPKEVLSSLTNLQVLKIVRCHMLTSVGGLETLSSLRYLTIDYCLNLTIEMPVDARSSFLKDVYVIFSPPGDRFRP